MKHIVRHTALGLAALALVTVASSPAAAQGKGPTVSIDGVGFAFFKYQLNNKPAGAPAPNMFEVSRAYVNVRGHLGGGAGVRVTSDLYRSGSDGSLQMRIKYAYASYKPKGSSIGFRFGQTTMAWLDWEEGLWGYRVQGPMATDRGHILSSADLGLAFDGGWGGNAFNLQGGIYDGTGYHGGTGDGHKAVDARVSFRVMPSDDNGSRGGLRVTGYGLYAGPQGGGQRYRAIGMASYKSKRLLLAGEYALASDSISGSGAAVKQHVISAYGTVNIPNSKAGILARVDVTDPNTATANDGHTLIIGGVSYKFAPGLMGIVDFENTSYQNSATPSLSNAFFHLQFSF